MNSSLRHIQLLFNYDYYLHYRRISAIWQYFNQKPPPKHVEASLLILRECSVRGNACHNVIYRVRSWKLLFFTISTADKVTNCLLPGYQLFIWKKPCIFISQRKSNFKILHLFYASIKIRSISDVTHTTK